jgi:ubiquitin-protein ligase
VIIDIPWNSIFERGTFKLELCLPEYLILEPEAHFMTKIYQTILDTLGRTCLDI